MPGQQVGSSIAASFGLVYVLVNAGPLGAPWAPVLRVLGAVAFAVVLVAIVRSGRPARPGGGRGVQVFGRPYWLVVAAEVVALLVGVRVLAGPLATPQAGVAWVSFVVGAHFFALAVVFRQRFFHVLGAAIAACGVAGLVLAAVGAGEAAIAAVGGVVPGAVLLAFGWWGARRTGVGRLDATSP